MHSGSGWTPKQNSRLKWGHECDRWVSSLPACHTVGLSAPSPVPPEGAFDDSTLPGTEVAPASGKTTREPLNPSPSNCRGTSSPSRSVTPISVPTPQLNSALGGPRVRTGHRCSQQDPQSGPTFRWRCPTERRGSALPRQYRPSARHCSHRLARPRSSLPHGRVKQTGHRTRSHQIGRTRLIRANFETF